MDPTGRSDAAFQPGQLFAVTFHAPDTRAETQTTLRYGVNERLELGFAYTWKDGGTVGVANYILAPETDTRPAVTLGVGVERVGGTEHAGFVMASKNLQLVLNRPVSAYAGLARREGETGLVGLAGANGALGRNLTGSLQYDGSDLHLGVQTRVGDVRLALLAVRLETPGYLVAYSW